MIRSLLIKCFLLISVFASADTITVRNIDELKKANTNARPGDIIILQNGEWKDVIIALNCTGTKEQPVTFKAQDAGKVLITGHSQLKLGGSFIVVDGFYFVNGYAGDDAVIDLRIDKKQLANNCRITNTVINDFNNPKRMDENYWVSFSGKNNRIDHCSFLNKKNMGVLMAVILDDDRSRENFHSIDHNYFGVRLPLASNSGEIIRVGVSQHCEFNSNTQIVDNFFEHCDGETEIISIKSCSNVVRNNLFKECQGGVVLRHGNYNTVENNVFLGNDKAGTGGVRVINKGQWVVNNLFYKCRGLGFRSPLSVMNGVPNSPAFRYVAVTDAVIANNSFVNCTPISLCEGSDTERTVPPNHVIFMNNNFDNNRDKLIYNSYDDISGFNFSGNVVNKEVVQQQPNGFRKTSLSPKGKATGIFFANIRSVVSDSLREVARTRLKNGFPLTTGYADINRYLQVNRNANTDCGAKWFAEQNKETPEKSITVNCKTGQELKERLAKKISGSLTINLTGDSYIFDEPLAVTGNVSITSNKKKLRFINSKAWPYLVEIKGGSTLSFVDIDLDLSGLNAGSFITSDLNGSSGHSNFSMKGCTIKNMKGNFFNAAKSTVFDSVVIMNNSFSGNQGTIFNFNNETDKKGYYNVEQLKMINNNFDHDEGSLLSILRGGNDESTMGPLLLFKNNTVNNFYNKEGQPLITLNGVQRSAIEQNRFTATNTTGILIQYEDAVRAAHALNNNTMINSGKINRNRYVTEKNNNIQ